MTSLDDLSIHIQNQDHKAFLLTYMELLAQGAQLEIPVRLDPEGIKQGWLDILPNVAGGYTDEFVDVLSNYWLGLVKKQGAKITDTFAKEIIAIIENKPFKSPQPETTQTPTSPTIQSSQSPSSATQQATNPPVPEQPAATNPVSQLDTIASQISADYYAYQEAKEVELLPKETLTAKLKQALASNQAEDFLVYYLSLVRHHEKISVPLTSVLDNIKSQWEGILMREFSYQASLDFLKAISAKWFYFVNHKGLPTNNEKLLDILYALLANFQPSKPAGSEVNDKSINKSQGFLQLFKNIFIK